MKTQNILEHSYAKSYRDLYSISSAILQKASWFDLPFPSLELYLASPSGHNGILLHSAWLEPALFPAVAQSLHCIVNCIYATKFAEIRLVGSTDHLKGGYMPDLE